MNTDMRKCPFCGSDDLQLVRSDIGHVFWVQCDECKTAGPLATIAIDEAVELWNVRADLNNV